MPGIIMYGLPADTSQVVLEQIMAEVAKLGPKIVGCPEDWMTTFFPDDLYKGRRSVIWIRFETGIFETKPLKEAERIAKEMCGALTPKIHALLGWVGKVEAFPLALPLHLHSIYPHDN